MVIPAKAVIHNLLIIDGFRINYGMTILVNIDFWNNLLVIDANLYRGAKIAP
jgi:hypothetical protein